MLYCHGNTEKHGTFSVFPYIRGNISQSLKGGLYISKFQWKTQV